jgi:hypothetical protein
MCIKASTEIYNKDIGNIELIVEKIENIEPILN